MAFLSVLSYEHNVVSGLSTKSAENKKTGDKAIIFLFSDGLKSQFTNAKPILDKYGFKGTFDVVCNYVGKKNGYMDWNEIKSFTMMVMTLVRIVCLMFALQNCRRPQLNTKSENQKNAWMITE